VVGRCTPTACQEEQLNAPDQLSTTLHRLRRSAGLSGTDAARQANMSQSRISRFETVRQVPTEAEVRTLCALYQADVGERELLVRLARELRKRTVKARTVLAHGTARLQKRIGAIEAASALIRGFQPAIVFGLLQTADYTRALGRRDLTGDALDDHVSARLSRQTVLDTDRRFVLILTEGALRWHVGSPVVMAEQLDRLAIETERPNLELGVISWTTPVDMQALHGFHLYDDRAALVATETATALIVDQQDIADYTTRFHAFYRVAQVGQDARRLFERLAQDYRSLDATRA